MVPTIPYLTPPADIVNESLDRLGASAKIIGDMTDGTAVSEAARRNYGRVLRGLLRAAHWTFARKQDVLMLLGDATGQSASNISTFVEQPWTYAYAWPIDGVAGRWMPVGFPLSTDGTPTDGSGVPLTTAGPVTPPVPLMPARFLVSSSDQYPIMTGETDWSNMPDLQRTEGVGPISRRIILTDQPNALFVYTRLVTAIEEWDDLFRQAMVAAMAVTLAPTAIDDPKLRIVERDKQLGEARMVLADARVANGQDAGWPQTTDHIPNWITARNAGVWGYNGVSGVGSGFYGGAGYYLPWDAWSLGGSVF
jgi:hypothetical protein